LGKKGKKGKKRGRRPAEREPLFFASSEGDRDGGKGERGGRKKCAKKKRGKRKAAPNYFFLLFLGSLGKGRKGGRI